MNVSQVPTGLVNAASNGDMINLLVLKKAMNSSEVQGGAMIQMMEQSVNPHLGQKVDIQV
ncbi:YjfB family protein [Heliobacterium chlorum]|nr:YjfB family protein [Heliobacterium chlorum]